MISIKSKGNFKKANSFFEKLLEIGKHKNLDHYGQLGVEALSNSTPKDSGLTASSWRYSINRSDNGATIIWSNDNIQNGVNVAVLIQYGHATRNGGYVQGIDYINPALKPIFEKIAEDAWKEVTSA